MPKALERDINGGGCIAVWQITEPLDWWQRQLSFVAANEPPIEALSERRQLERWASRWLLCHLLGEEAYQKIQKAETGNLLTGRPDLFVSISHSYPWAAAWIGPKPGGIDIQVCGETMERIAPRILRPEELASISTAYKRQHLYVYWGAKEALYKAYSRRGLDFRKNLLVVPFSFSMNGGPLEALLQVEDSNQPFELSYELLEDAVLVYTHP